MAFAEYLMVAIAFAIFLENQVDCEGPTSEKSDASSIPILASGKRQHNIMRFGKRPAGGHNLIHFGKKDGASKPPQHSFLYFGKREDGSLGMPNLFHYLQNNRDSYKRGHTIMRFGKRGGENHNFIRFGRGYDDDLEDYYPEEEEAMEDEKRDGHSMLYFGKRTTGHNMLSFGKRDDDKRAHSMIHFGKRQDDDGDDDEGYPDEVKRAHAMIHFGKRDYLDSDPDESKRGSHSMIHFGKRDFGEEYVPYFLNPALSEKRQHNLLRFGKKTEGSRKGSHAMIHFGKRDDEMSEEKRAHSMIHFGKRSVDQKLGSSINQSDEENPKTLNRMKRQIMDQVLPNDGFSSHYDYEPQVSLPYDPEEEPVDYASYVESGPPDKKDASKNVFLRFG